MTVNLNAIAKTVALTVLPGIADGRARKLIEDFGSPEAVYDASFDSLNEYHYIDDATYEKLGALDSVINELEERYATCQEQGIGLIPFFDDRYPDRLNTVSGPLLLYARGNISLIHHKDSVGFTGTRKASAEAVEWTKETAKTLAESGRVVISGGATGIDTAAHQGTLEADGHTIVILGTGITVPYPKGNEELFERIVDQGGLLLSQREPQAGPSRAGFLNRNQTLTGLSQAVTVVATDGSGGTMSTYDDACTQDRLVFCPDPELGLNPTAGIKQILHEDGATPVVRAEEILAYQERQMEDVNKTVDDPEQDAEEGASDQFSINDFG